MKITNQLIRSKTRQSSLQSIKYLNLSNLEICILEKLGSCCKLQSLNVSHNLIESIPTTIEQCPQLWSFNVSNNKVQSLDGFGRFVAIGTLDLSNNQLSWFELSKLQHLHILDLRLHGNSQLEKDPYYRIHVIDCLPNVWMVDGRLVTTAERIQVKLFFDDSAVSERPVRHKLSASRSFVPSTQKNREVNGIFGDRVIHLMQRFPRQDVFNIDLDVRRLQYLSENMAQDIIVHSSNLSQRREVKAVISETFLVEMLETRKHDALRCNMFIMLLLTSLEFKIPDSLFKETLELMKLDKFGNVNGMEVFALSRESRALVSGILLSAVKVERVDKQTGGLYDKLYLCLNYLLTECIKSCSGKSSAPTGLYRQYRSLLAAEVVLLMCYVPSFSEYMHKEPGVMSLVTCATNDAQIISNVLTLKESLQRQEAGELEQIQALGQFIQSAVMFSLSRTPGNVSGLKGQSAEQKIFSKRPLPKRPMSGPVFSSTYHTRGKTSPNVKPPRVISAKPKPAKQPDVGETVLTSPQCLARIVSLPQPDIALVLLEMIPVNGGMKSKPQSFEEHYAYIDTKELEWDAARFYWKPKGTAGNRVTLHYVEDASLLTRPLSQLDDTSIHHHSSGGVTSITVPMPFNTTERTSLILDLDTHQDPLTVSPPKPGSVPAPSPIYTPPRLLSPTRPTAATTDLIPEHVELGKLSLAEPVESTRESNATNNNSVADPNMNGTMSAVEINTDISLQERIASELSNRVEIPSTSEPLISSHEQTNEMPSTKTPLNISPPKSPSHLSVVQIGAPPPPHQRLSFGAPEQPKSSSLKLSQEQTESKTSAELSHQGEKTNDLSDSDEELLSDLAREDLIRDTLSNAEHSIPDRSFAPSNSPDMRVRHGSRSSNHTSRQHSANINSVYGMLRAEQAFKTSTTLHRPQVSAYNSDVYSVYSEGRSVDWCSKIHNPDDTPNVSVKWANLWMGGGRDLHLEEMRSRPSSAHVPGWKDGLKGTARTRSAHTMRFAKTKNHRQLSATNYSSKTTSRNSTYNKQLEWQQYKFRPTNSSFRRSAGLSCLPHFNSTESLEYETRDC